MPLSPAQQLAALKQAEAMRKRWSDPAYRERMLQKQKAVGFRQYPEASDANPKQSPGVQTH